MAYMIIVKNDTDEPKDYEYDSLSSALEAFGKYKDHGFAKDIRVVILMNRNKVLEIKKFVVPEGEK